METNYYSWCPEVYRQLRSQINIYHKSIKSGSHLIKGQVPAFREQIRYSYLSNQLKRSLYELVDELSETVQQIYASRFSYYAE